MRTIKFRAWDEEFLQMIYDPHCHLDNYDGDINYEFKNNTYVKWMQFTGLHDKNGREIYEGDILRDETGKGVVKWVPEHCAFLVHVREPAGYHYLESDGHLERTEVIGNIYENPELLMIGEE